jgi:hypothetical protein
MRRIGITVGQITKRTRNMSSAIKVGDTLPLSETFAEAVWSDEGKDYCGLVKPPVPASEGKIYLTYHTAHVSSV